MLCWYDDLATQPALTAQRVYAFLNLDYPGDHIVHDVRASSVGKGNEVELSPQIAQLCEELLNRLRQTEKAAQMLA